MNRRSEERLDVLVVGPVPPELGSGNPGGVARVAWTQAKALCRRGCRVRLLAVGRYRRGDRRIDGVALIGLRWGLRALVVSLVRWIRFQHRLPSCWTLWHRLYLLYTTYRLATVESPGEVDVVHIHAPYSGGPVALRVLGLTTPSVVTVHSYNAVGDPVDGEPGGMARLYTDVLRRADAVVHVSRAEMERGRALGVRWSSPGHVVHNPVELPPSGPLPGPDERSGVCFVGGLHRAKGILALLRLWEEHPPRGQTLTIAGSGDLEPSVRSAADRSGNIRYMGYLDRGRTRALVRASMCLAVPSYRESFGLVYLESLVEGTPAVGYHGTLREIRQALDGSVRDSGYIQPLNLGTEGLPGLRAAIERAFEARTSDRDGEVAAKLGHRVAMVFGEERTAVELEAVYREAARGAGKRRA